MEPVLIRIFLLLRLGVIFVTSFIMKLHENEQENTQNSLFPSPHNSIILYTKPFAMPYSYQINSLEQYHEAIDAARSEFLKTFGQDNFYKATGCRQVR